MNRRWAVGGLQGYGGSGAIKSSVILGGAAGVSGDKSSESPSFCPSHSTHGGFLQGGGMMKLMMLCHHPLLLHNNRGIKLEYGTFKCKWKSVAFRCLQNYFRLCWLNLLMPGNFLDILQYTEYTHWKNEIDIKRWWAGPGVSKQKRKKLRLSNSQEKAEGEFHGVIQEVKLYLHHFHTCLIQIDSHIIVYSLPVCILSYKLTLRQMQWSNWKTGQKINKCHKLVWRNYTVGVNGCIKNTQVWKYF